jgi:hypothetical protein
MRYFNNNRHPEGSQIGVREAAVAGKLSFLGAFCLPIVVETKGDSSHNLSMSVIGRRCGFNMDFGGVLRHRKLPINVSVSNGRASFTDHNLTPKEFGAVVIRR